MKNNFIFLAIFLIALISLASAFESEQYNISTNVNEGGINVGIGNDINVNITECTVGETNCSGTNYLTCADGSWVNNGNVNGLCGYTTPVQTSSSGGGSPGGNSRTVSSLLSSAIDLLSNDNSNGNSNENQNLDLDKKKSDELNEESSSTSFMNAAVVGVSDFVKSPKGKISVGIIILISAGAIFISVKKRNVKIPEEKSLESENSETETNL
jgi:hypothetical protein